VRILFDSHSLFWFLEGDRRLSATARTALESEGAIGCVSAVTAWEITNKVRLGKWAEATALAEAFTAILARYAFQPLPITIEHARVAGLLPGRHRDPFDRMLAAQAQVEDIPLVSADPVFRAFDVRILW
jgi:PIN domain nuclease of toxin-antitoxin system